MGKRVHLTAHLLPGLFPGTNPADSPISSDIPVIAGEQQRSAQTLPSPTQTPSLSRRTPVGRGRLRAPSPNGKDRGVA
jgi:hypothetical protein